MVGISAFAIGYLIYLTHCRNLAILANTLKHLTSLAVQFHLSFLFQSGTIIVSCCHLSISHSAVNRD